MKIYKCIIYYINLHTKPCVLAAPDAHSSYTVGSHKLDKDLYTNTILNNPHDIPKVHLYIVAIHLMF